MQPSATQVVATAAPSPQQVGPPAPLVPWLRIVPSAKPGLLRPGEPQAVVKPYGRLVKLDMPRVPMSAETRRRLLQTVVAFAEDESL